MRQMTPQVLAAYLGSTQPLPLLLDVREPWEFQICHLEGAELVPMREIPHALERLDRNRETVVICHHGIRSRQVAMYLEHQGFTNVINMQGGVAAWATEVDPGMATY